jgi:hypothetical protein
MAEDNRAVEIDVLLIFGTFATLFGLLLVPIGAGRLPCNLDSAYGLFLVLIAFQTVTIGKSPFGDMRRSWLLVICGFLVAAFGMVACFIPGALSQPVRATVGVVLVAGGISLLLQLFFSRSKARLWLGAGPVLAQLTLACALVYALGIALGMVALVPGAVTNEQNAIVLLADGGAVFYLAWLLHKVERLYAPQPGERPGASSPHRFAPFRSAVLPLRPALLILLGLSLVLLGMLLVPVSLGLMPFSPDGQLGLLLTVMAIQVMALGDTPIGSLKGPGWMLAVGLTFAAAGIVAAIVPGLLTDQLRLLLGSLNLISGAGFLLAAWLKRGASADSGPDGALPIVRSLGSTQTALSWLSVVFGVSMLAPRLIPGIAMPVLIVANGATLIRLASILMRLEAQEPISAGAP